MVKRTITITTILLILTMAVGLIVMLNKSSFAADDDIASGTSGTCSWVIDSEGTLTIRPTDGVSGILDSNYPSNGIWYTYRDQITKVEFENEVYSGNKCSSLFYNFSKCREISLENLNISNSTNMNFMFKGCSSLISIDVSNLDTSNVKSMIELFYNCASLTELDLSSLNTENVTDISGLVRKCSKLEYLNITNLNTSKVKDMRYMFIECSSLTNIDLTSWDFSNVTNMDSMFVDCNKATSINLAGIDISNVSNMYQLFAGCESLEYLNLAGWDTRNVRTMSYMFLYDNKLKEIVLSENFKFLYTLPFPSGPEYTKKWIREDGLYGPYTPYELKDNYDGSTMAGTWVWEKASYTVSYSYTGIVPNEASELPQNKLYINGEEVTVAQDATASGYTFSGWSRTGTFEMPAEDVTITGSFTANTDTPYIVEHYLEDEILGTYTLKETENLTGITDTTKRATPKTYAGYTFDDTIEETIQEGTIKGDGSLVLKLYYRKNEVPVENNHKYKVQYFFDGIIDDSLEEIINAEVDSEVNITPITPIKHGEKNYTLVSNNHKITISVNDDDNIIRVYYETDVLDYAIDGDATEGDGIPDKYQISITYKVENGNWNDGTKGTKIDVITLKDKDGNLSEDGTGTTSIPEVGNKPSEGYEVGSWNEEIPSQVSREDDGKVFVYSYKMLEKQNSEQKEETDITEASGKIYNPKTDDIVNKYLLAGIDGILVLALVNKIRRKYSRKAKKVQF